MDNTRPALEGIERPTNAVDVPPGVHRDVAHPTPVRVRLIWPCPENQDIETWVDSLAVEWTRELVRVQTRDPRLYPRVVWVRAEDVRRG